MKAFQFFKLTSLIFVLAIIGLSSCHKPAEVVIPEPCMTANKTEVIVADSVTFTDCSVSVEQVQLIIFESKIGNPPPESPYYVFNERREVRVAFNQPGEFTCLLRAINMNAPTQEAKVSVLVKEK